MYVVKFINNPEDFLPFHSFALNTIFNGVLPSTSRFQIVLKFGSFICVGLSENACFFLERDLLLLGACARRTERK